MVKPFSFKFPKVIAAQQTTLKSTPLAFTHVTYILKFDGKLSCAAVTKSIVFQQKIHNL